MDTYCKGMLTVFLVVITAQVHCTLGRRWRVENRNVTLGAFEQSECSKFSVVNHTFD